MVILYQITTIGRYGSGTTRSKIPIGAFYGHSYILPWEWSQKSEHHVSPGAVSGVSQLDLPTQSQLLSHLGSFMSLLEDIQVMTSYTIVSFYDIMEPFFVTENRRVLFNNIEFLHMQGHLIETAADISFSFQTAFFLQQGI